MIDEKSIKIIAHWVLKIVMICIGFYIVFINLSSIWNGISWIVAKLMPFIIGIVLSIILNIPLKMIETKLKMQNPKIKRGVSIALTLLCTLGLFIILIVLIVPEFYHAIKMIIDLSDETLNQLALSDGNAKETISILNNIDTNWIEIKEKLELWIQTYSGNFMNHMITMFKSTASMIVTLFIALIFSIYVLSNKETLLSQGDSFMKIWCNEKLYHAIYYLANLSVNSFTLFMISQVTEAIILGVLCGVGMAILRIPYALMIGVFIGVTALVPYFGAILGEVVGFVLIAAVDPIKAIIFFIYVLIIQQIEGNIIYPKVVGSKVKLAPIWVFVAIMFGGNVAGPLGMFFAVPVASIIYTLTKELTNKRAAKQEVRCVQ